MEDRYLKFKDIKKVTLTPEEQKAAREKRAAELEEYKNRVKTIGQPSDKGNDDFEAWQKIKPKIEEAVTMPAKATITADMYEKIKYGGRRMITMMTPDQKTILINFLDQIIIDQTPDARIALEIRLLVDTEQYTPLPEKLQQELKRLTSTI